MALCTIFASARASTACFCALSWKSEYPARCDLMCLRALRWQGLPPAEGKVGWGKLMVTFPSADDLLDEVTAS